MPSKVARNSAATPKGEREHLSACAPQDARHALVADLGGRVAEKIDRREPKQRGALLLFGRMPRAKGRGGRSDCALCDPGHSDRRLLALARP
jgi:hypothetical protein